MTPSPEVSAVTAVVRYLDRSGSMADDWVLAFLWDVDEKAAGSRGCLRSARRAAG